MKIKTRTFLKTKVVLCKDNVTRIISVYGELDEHDYVDGVIVVPCTIKGKSSPIEPAEISEDYTFIPSGKSKYGRTKEFYMGFAICSLEDDFSEDKAIALCKRRFKEPITTQNGRMLTKDMIDAIMSNEITFISENIERFLPKKKTNK